MDNTAPDRRQPVKGSWEDLLAQAEEYSRNFNDAAIPLYERVVNGLAKLSPAARASANQRLHKLFMRAALDLQGFYNMRSRPDDALATLALIRSIATEETDQEMADLFSAQIKLNAGRFEEGVAFFATKVEEPDARLSDWQPLIWSHVHFGRAAEALPLLPKLAEAAQAKLNDPAPADDEDEDGIFANPIAFSRALHALVYLETGRYDEAFAAYDELLAMGKEFTANAFTVYSRLIQQGRYEDAPRYLDQDRTRPIRAAFWRGLLYHLTDEPKRARHQFEIASNQEGLQQDQRSIVEFILAHYFLGDPEARGLELILGVLREQKNLDWIMLYLAGIGWAVRGDYSTAHSNLRLAATQLQWRAEGLGIPRLYWFITQALLPTERHAELQQYFAGDPTVAADTPSAETTE